MTRKLHRWSTTESATVYIALAAVPHSTSLMHIPKVRAVHFWKPSRGCLQKLKCSTCLESVALRRSASIVIHERNPRTMTWSPYSSIWSRVELARKPRSTLTFAQTNVVTSSSITTISTTFYPWSSIDLATRSRKGAVKIRCGHSKGQTQCPCFFVPIKQTMHSRF